MAPSPNESLKTQLYSFSIWTGNCLAIFHKGTIHTQAGENPELRGLFSKFCHLLRAPLTPVFVFDGCGHPQQKRGREVRSDHPLWLTAYVKTLITAFGFYY